MQPPGHFRHHAHPSPAGSSRGDADARDLVLLGASVRAAAQSARRAGYRVSGVDLFGDRDARAACERFVVIDQRSDPQRLIDFCGNRPVVLVGGLDDRWPVCAALESHRASLARTGTIERLLANPDTLRTLAAQAGLRFPPTRTITPPAGETPQSPRPDRETPRPDREAAAGPSVRWLRKQTRSSGGVGVRWESDRHPTGPASESPATIQQWIAGKSWGVTFLSDGHTAVMLGACRSWFTRCGSKPFVYAGSFGPLPVTPERASALSALGQAVVSLSGIEGIFNADLIVDRQGTAWLLEINPRWSGSSELIERRLDSDGMLGSSGSLFAAAMDAAGGSVAERWTPTAPQCQPRRPWYAKRILFARHDLRFENPAWSETRDPALTVGDLPIDGTPIPRRSPVMSLLLRIEPDEDPAARVRQTVRRWQARLSSCRVG